MTDPELLHLAIRVETYEEFNIVNGFFKLGFKKLVYDEYKPDCHIRVKLLFPSLEVQDSGYGNSDTYGGGWGTTIISFKEFLNTFNLNKKIEKIKII